MPERRAAPFSPGGGFVSAAAPRSRAAAAGGAPAGGGGGTSRSGALRGDRRYVRCGNELRRADLLVFGEGDVHAVDVDLVAVHQRRRIHQRDAVDLYLGRIIRPTDNDLVIP